MNFVEKSGNYYRNQYWMDRILSTRGIKAEDIIIEFKPRYLSKNLTIKEKIDREIFSYFHQLIKKNRTNEYYEDILGYSNIEFKTRFNKLFKKGMSWANHGEWHIDHIIPRSVFGFKTIDDVDFRRCWKLNNLQPLWREENLIKKNTILVDFQHSFVFYPDKIEEDLEHWPKTAGAGADNTGQGEEGD